jgi:carbohydrate-selective porin OprB
VDPCKGTVRFKRQQLAHSRRKAGLPTEIGWKKPKGKCTICGKKHVTLVPDHNHKTKKLRDWICGPCNRALGFFEKKNAVKFLRYLARHKENK